eukprot:1004097-Amorphochlora_amoeboformis.AAC.1
MNSVVRWYGSCPRLTVVRLDYDEIIDNFCAVVGYFLSSSGTHGFRRLAAWVPNPFWPTSRSLSNYSLTTV